MKSSLIHFSDHKPVSMTLQSMCFGEKLALEKNLLAYQPVIHFQTQPESNQWFTGEDGTVEYTIDTNAGQILDSWDWIGLYHVSNVKQLWLMRTGSLIKDVLGLKQLSQVWQLWYVCLRGGEGSKGVTRYLLGCFTGCSSSLKLLNDDPQEMIS